MHSATLNPANLLRQHAATTPTKAALHYPVGVQDGKVLYQQLTYQDIEQLSDQAAYALRQAGFRPGDKTVFMLKPGPELFIQVFALFKIGAIPVVVDPGMGIKRMLHCFRRVGAETFMGIPVATLVRLIARRMFASIRASVTIVGGKIWRQQRLLAGIDTRQPYPIYQADSQAPALIVHTTGSTGPAKAVDCTQLMAHAMMDAMRLQANMSEGDVQLLTLPFFGVLGMMIGNTCVLPKMDPTTPLFDPGNRGLPGELHVRVTVAD
jgi:acyl-coenzyme A synthetase/AMP-(fatty) acid ligase